MKVQTILRFLHARFIRYGELRDIDLRNVGHATKCFGEGREVALRSRSTALSNGRQPRRIAGCSMAEFTTEPCSPTADLAGSAQVSSTWSGELQPEQARRAGVGAVVHDACAAEGDPEAPAAAGG